MPTKSTSLQDSHVIHAGIVRPDEIVRLTRHRQFIVQPANGSGDSCTNKQHDFSSNEPFIPSATSHASAVSSSGAVDRQDSSLGIGAIAEVAVVAAAGGISIFVCMAFFIWRHRKHEKSTRPVERTEIVEQEKAQLYSDEYKPKRKEMQGSIVPKRIRTVGGLSE